MSNPKLPVAPAIAKGAHDIAGGAALEPLVPAAAEGAEVEVEKEEPAEDPRDAMATAASELLRAVRGKRSQVAFARRLGYRANPITDWENGRRFPTAAEALRAASRAGIDVSASLGRFHAAAPPSQADLSSGAPEQLAEWLCALRGSTPIGAIAERSGRSRFAIARWLRGEAEPRLPDFLRLIDAVTGRLPDLVAEIVPIDEVPTLALRHRTAAAAKRLAFEEPWTEAILRLLETTAYRAQAKHDAGWLSRQLDIAEDDVARCVSRLLEAGIVQQDGAHIRVAGALTVDTRTDPLAMRALLAHWCEVALARHGRGRSTDLFAYNVFSVTHADLARVRELLRSTFRELRAIVAASEPSETAALVNLQLVAFRETDDLPPPAPGRVPSAPPGARTAK
jgi:transcriptional regulator with XRE-family HTH domain